MFGIVIAAMLILFGVLKTQEKPLEREKVSAEFTGITPSSVYNHRGIFRAGFEFEYKGKAYSTKLDIGMLDAKNYTKGNRYDIYINPENPKDASFSLITEEPARGLLLIAAGAILLIITIPFLLVKH